jgi:catechol 2,3-dioxygenase-like lactoylglutathione lyase family enzyme
MGVMLVPTPSIAGGPSTGEVGHPRGRPESAHTSRVRFYRAELTDCDLPSANQLHHPWGMRYADPPGLLCRAGLAGEAGSSDDFATFEAGAALLALCPLGQLGREAAPGEPVPGKGWSGITLGVNVESIEAVDETFRSALAAGARAVAGPVTREWGGYSGYISDPEGNRWEMAWVPGS